MDSALAGFGVLSFVGFGLFLVLIVVLWIALPFAVFGTKDLLRQLIREQKRTNELLQAQANRAKEIRERAEALRS